MPKAGITRLLRNIYGQVDISIRDLRHGYRQQRRAIGGVLLFGASACQRSRLKLAGITAPLTLEDVRLISQAAGDKKFHLLAF
ncbi:hypothetical protein DNH61_12875 [Paenibacillus sambharensis]|uniref:Uncharacterized protein n=1 Tax=Paenibacillus sambharensis TaxID=1803190 RepID=A0A2W1LK98_9BACL|nr:hypothetical protein DNH61_12875 [Paenibacillus sambharensis]